MDIITIKTNAGLVSGSIHAWIAAFLRLMSPELKAKVYEEVKQMEGDTVVLLNPDGSTTTVLKAQKGVLKAVGADLGGGS